MYNFVTFLGTSLLQLKRSNDIALAVQEVANAARLSQLASVLSTLPVLGSVFLPVARFLKFGKQKPGLPTGLPTDLPQSLNPDNLNSYPLGTDIEDIFSNSSRLTQKILEIGADPIYQQLVEHFVQYIFPILTLVQGLCELSLVYISFVFIVNMIFFYRNREKSEKKPVVLTATFLANRCVFYLPLELFKPSIRISIPFSKKTLILALFFVIVNMLGFEMLAMLFYSMAHKISVVDFQFALTYYAVNTHNGEPLIQALQSMNFIANNTVGSSSSTVRIISQKTINFVGLVLGFFVRNILFRRPLQLPESQQATVTPDDHMEVD
mmetsp:Transcript_14353/g.27566  ORF Transcript_14353/g.27566 Transcript_14353/m.27566 type:complete len:323 (+) Transcript_14353:317-1285(+)